MLLKDKRAVVTGGSRGLGRAIAMRLASDGATVVIVATDRSRIRAVLDEIKKAGGQAEGKACDVSDRLQVTRAVEEIVREQGHIDILVNSAGVAKLEPFLELSPDTWHKLIDVHLSGTFYMSQAVARIMVERKYGKIINISSTAALMGASIGVAAYAAAKGGIISLTRTMAAELSPYKINVNAIAPGPVATEGLKEAYTPEILAERSRSIPLGRLAEPADIAEMALFLASAASDYITGQIFVVDGGLQAVGSYITEIYKKRGRSS